MNGTDRRVPWALLAAFALLPGVQTLVAVYWQWHAPVTYPALKAVMIAVPIVCWLALRRPRVEVFALTGLKRPNLAAGAALGTAMAGVILAGYYLVLRGRLDPHPLVAKVRSLGLLDYYWAMAAVVCLWNALFEEYYWRAFLVGEAMQHGLGLGALVALGGAFFGIHHVFALAPLFAWPLVASFTFGTMLAGATWTLMRCRGRSIWECYVGHILADAAIMWIGWDLIRQAR